MLHAIFALSFAGAWITGDSERWRWLHVTLGYTMAGALGFRLVYGLVGPQPTRWSALWRKIAALPGWARGLLARVEGRRPAALHRHGWLQGQAPLMGAAVGVLVAGALPLVLSGVAADQAWSGEWLEEIHEFLAQLMLIVVLAHIGLVGLFSMLRRRNLAAPMLTGYVSGVGPDLVRRNHAWLAILLLVAAIAFAVWHWNAGAAGAGIAANAPGITSPSDDDDD
jgi:cytochrome b